MDKIVAMPRLIKPSDQDLRTEFNTLFLESRVGQELLEACTKKVGSYSNIPIYFGIYDGKLAFILKSDSVLDFVCIISSKTTDYRLVQNPRLGCAVVAAWSNPKKKFSGQFLLGLLSNLFDLLPYQYMICDSQLSEAGNVMWNMFLRKQLQLGNKVYIASCILNTPWLAFRINTTSELQTAIKHTIGRSRAYEARWSLVCKKSAPNIFNKEVVVTDYNEQLLKNHFKELITEIPDEEADRLSNNLPIR